MWCMQIAELHYIYKGLLTSFLRNAEARESCKHRCSFLFRRVMISEEKEKERKQANIIMAVHYCICPFPH